MRKEFITMLIIIVCAILGVISAIMVKTLYTNGVILDELIINTISIEDVQFFVFFAWLIVGIIAGVLRK